MHLSELLLFLLFTVYRCRTNGKIFPTAERVLTFSLAHMPVPAFRKTSESISPNGVNYAGPVYEQPIESSMSLSNPSSDPLPKPAIVNVQTSHYSSCPQGVSSPSVTCPPNVAAALPSNQPALHANSFTVNTFTLRKAQTQAQGVQASGAATLFPYSTVNFGDTSSEKVQCHQPVNYAQVSHVHSVGFTMGPSIDDVTQKWRNLTPPPPQSPFFIDVI